MFIQFIKTSIRIFFREGFYSILNLMGLSTGITVALIILLYLQQDLTYDHYYKNAKNIYRVNSIYISSGKENKFALSPVAFGPRIFEEYPEIRSYVRIVGLGKKMISYGDEKFPEDEICLADSTVFDIFSHRFVTGNPESCFRSPNSIVLTEKLASKIFKGKNPIGETIALDRTEIFQVTGIIQDLPDNVHYRYSALVPIKKYDPRNESRNASFYNISVYTYILAPENYDTHLFYEKFPAFYEKYAAKDGIAYNQQYKAIIQPLLDIHFSGEWQFDRPNGNKSYITAFLIIGLLVLALACINYLNMATARAERRKREIAAKKILGSSQTRLVIQFLGESLFIAMASMLVALGMTQFFLEFTSLNQLIDKDLHLALIQNPWLLAGVPLLTLFVGLTSGMYPSFYLSQVHPLTMIRGKMILGRSRGWLRKALVVVQMVISIGVIICTLLIDKQIEYVRKRDVGINKENILVLPLRDTLVANHISAFKEQLLQNNRIVSITTAYNLPAEDVSNNLYRVETENGMEEQNFFSLFTSYDFINTMGIKILEGRDFSRDIQSDFRTAFIINESLAKKMGWHEPLGKRLQQSFATDGKPYFDGVIIGVVRDFNFTSLHNAIEPMVLRLQRQEGGQMIVRLSGQEMIQGIKDIETTWNAMGGEFPSDYRFLDEDFDRLYKKDRQQNRLIRTFSWVCILISCLGLLSLSSYITSNRTKEIVVRKVLGASMYRLTLMIYKETLILVMISTLFAFPLAYWITNKLLQNFAYRAPVNLSVFLITMLGAILVALGTVSYHSIKAAHSDPARSLKFE
jgi:putative ABC transport system permease protein